MHHLRICYGLLNQKLAQPWIKTITFTHMQINTLMFLCLSISSNPFKSHFVHYLVNLTTQSLWKQPHHDPYATLFCHIHILSLLLNSPKNLPPLALTSPCSSKTLATREQIVNDFPITLLFKPKWYYQPRCNIYKVCAIVNNFPKATQSSYTQFLF